MRLTSEVGRRGRWLATRSLGGRPTTQTHLQTHQAERTAVTRLSKTHLVAYSEISRLNRVGFFVTSLASEPPASTEVASRDICLT